MFLALRDMCDKTCSVQLAMSYHEQLAHIIRIAQFNNRCAILPNANSVDVHLIRYVDFVFKFISVDPEKLHDAVVDLMQQ